MIVSRKEIETSLPNKGFERDDSRDHIRYRHMYQGRYTGIVTWISHSRRERDIARDLLMLMKRQLRLDTNKEAFDLLSCPMGGDEYINILIEREKIQI